MKILALILLSIALILEASLTTLPLVFLALLVLLVLSKENWLFGFGFIFGILLDLVGFRTLGLSSAFFVLSLFLVLLYQSKFEIETNTFVFLTILAGSFIYLFLVGDTDLIIVQAVVSSIIGLIMFKVVQRANIKG